jgi:tetratricopeptide (TPR) repeat protein
MLIEEGESLYKTGDLIGARRFFESLLSQDPQNPEIHNNLGVVLAELGEVELACHHFREAISLCPGHKDARLNYLMVLRAKNDPAKFLRARGRGPMGEASHRPEEFVHQEKNGLENLLKPMARLVQRLREDPLGFVSSEEGLIGELIRLWGNPIWSAGPEYLQACVLHLCNCQGPVLECGSGLTTIVAGALAQDKGLEYFALEHDSRWAKKVAAFCGSLGIESVKVLEAPLRRYERGFFWYEAPFEEMPDRFSLIICDGPPGSVPGGRYGLVPVMRGKLRKGCVILLDDAHREGEQRIARMWEKELPATLEQKGSERPYFELIVEADRLQ